MSTVKSFSVGHGDMFCINHNSDNFTIIDCCLPSDRQDDIIGELTGMAANKGITRFISTHPDEDHCRGLTSLDEHLSILNFYCVTNSATKGDESDDFVRYCELRDSDKAFHIYKACKRRWMNMTDGERGMAGIDILWPDTSNAHFLAALIGASEGLSPNNISPIVRYIAEDWQSFLWMGDLETSFLEDIEGELALPKVSVLFAPHHGRYSGKIPAAMLEQMDPQLIVIGEAPSEHLHYYDGYNTITQNSAGDIVFECVEDYIHVYVGSDTYSADFLVDRSRPNSHGYYIGSLRRP